MAVRQAGRTVRKTSGRCPSRPPARNIRNLLVRSTEDVLAYSTLYTILVMLDALRMLACWFLALCISWGF